MKITINGKKTALKSPQTLAAIVRQTCKEPQYVVAEVNGKIVKSNGWAKTVIRENDAIELVSFVGGG
ncbi:MAG: sulfur carrier protein ThiS [Candidatus Omnitrophica bacterium]|nr:sulfur carrier protein ThiS [Candidatus Omnitrophota bacterium]